MESGLALLREENARLMAKITGRAGSFEKTELIERVAKLEEKQLENVVIKNLSYRSAMANPSIYNNNKVKNIHTVSLGQICNMNQISKEQVNAKTKIPMKNFYFRKGLHMIFHILPRFM